MQKINVTKVFLPPLEEYYKYLRGIWQGGQVTNHGTLVNELEKKLRCYFGAKYVYLVSNGTVALQLAVKALDLKNEVITTPFSYIATSSGLIWQGCKPVYADIDSDTLTIDPKEIVKHITEKTTGIVATHVYGNPCDIEAITKIAKKYRLKVLYDAAHAFGVKCAGKSILTYGDVSAISFHATKLFNTVEGGAVVTNNKKIADKIFYLRNFGHTGAKRPNSFHGIGINGKNTELHAAMGLCILPRVKEIIERRKCASALYDKFLSDNVRRQTIRENTDYNYAYYPVVFTSEKVLLRAQSSLNKANIFPRRYFYPALNTVDYIKELGVQVMPVTEDIARRVLCLPIYYDIKISDIKKITSIIYDSF
jgi:dTDP-4-amino-4,6-dideoxygalactose transaminase